MPPIRPLAKQRGDPEPISNPVPLHGHRYPWEEWFGRLPITLQRGRDYHCRTDGMAVNVYVAAQRIAKQPGRKDFRVSVLTDPNGRWLTIRRREKDA